MSTPELVSQLVDRAEDDDVFVRHAAACDALRGEDPDILGEIHREDRLWDQSDLASPIRPT
ncbi:MAG TPA: hypothetical protein VG294_04425 [Solirubrobacteraceae bacterium]|jgi:hypothetical protein|nr:hypothetical protein [Solirubrobacteraceae bacterium]